MGENQLAIEDLRILKYAFESRASKSIDVMMKTYFLVLIFEMQFPLLVLL